MKTIQRGEKLKVQFIVPFADYVPYNDMLAQFGFAPYMADVSESNMPSDYTGEALDEDEGYVLFEVEARDLDEAAFVENLLSYLVIKRKK